MDLLKQFRLTKLLHDQVELAGDDITTVLQSWNEKDYNALVDYIAKCEQVVPKYVLRLARRTRLEPLDVVHEILGARSLVQTRRGRPAKNEPDATYIPEDGAERDQFLRSIVGERKRY